MIRTDADERGGIEVSKEPDFDFKEG